LSTLDDKVAFITNPDPRCPCLLLLDTSSSMTGSKIEELNNGLRAFEEDISNDELARRRCEIAIITFGNGGVQTIQNFVTADEFHAPHLSPGGNTPMGEAIYRGLDLLRARKQTYKDHSVAYYRPWVFLITDGEPTDDKWQEAAQLVRLESDKNGLVFFAVGVEGANMQKLMQIAVPKRPPVMLQGVKFVELFVWLSQSQRNVSASRVGEQVSLPSIDGWASL
jgi:uncharacterized protein YegL